MLDALSFDIIGPALLAGLLVLSTHVPFGSIVLDRGIVFIDIAIAQVAALGVVLGATYFGELHGLPAQASAFSAALLASLLLIWTDKRAGAMQEAVIGVVFVLAAALQIIVLSTNPGGGEALKEMLVGQILLVTPRDLLPVLFAYAAVLALWMWRDLAQERVLFYTLFAVIITLSVQIVGVLLVFASLIVPALAARPLGPRWRLLAAFNIGVVGYVSGLILSALRDLPTGATVVCTIIATAIVASFALGLRGAAKSHAAPAIPHSTPLAPAVVPLVRPGDARQADDAGGERPDPRRRPRSANER